MKTRTFGFVFACVVLFVASAFRAGAQEDVGGEVGVKFAPATWPYLLTGSTVLFENGVGIAAYDVSSRAVVQLTDKTTLKKRDYEPSVSPDGTQVVFMSARSGVGYLFHILDVRTGLVRALAGGGNSGHPVWGPDGIYYSDGNGGVWRTDASGSVPSLVTKLGRASIASLAIAPDGKTLAMSVPYGMDDEIYVVRTDGTGLKRLTFGTSVETEECLSPSWALDAKSGQLLIVYSYDRSRSGGWTEFSIRAMTMGGVPVGTLASVADSDGGGALEFDATSSLDGELFASLEIGGRHGLYRFDTAGVPRLVAEGIARGISWYEPGYFSRYTPPKPTNAADVNGDSVVNIVDLVLVAQAFGEASGPADVNGDSVVNIVDLVLVAQQFGWAADVIAAPSRKLRPGSDQRDEILARLKKLQEEKGNAATEADVTEILKDFVPAVEPRDKLPTTWAELKR